MITIFTPTYNRSVLLERIYDSLIIQNNKDFEWLIVDDGSMDNTKEVVQKWIDEDKIKIRYIYQKNQGKYVAFNTGVNNANGELFFCVDSDDFLPNNAIELIYKAWSKNTYENIAGIIALKENTNGERLSDALPNSINKSSAYNLAFVHNCRGEWSLIYRTDILRNNLFPVISGEKFITECVVYDKIDLNFELILLNEVLTICEYQSDGLTSSIFSTMLKNPTGYKIFYNQRIDMAYTISERLGYIIRYNAFDILSKDNSFNYNGKYKLLVRMLKPLGWGLTKYYNYKKVTIK